MLLIGLSSVIGVVIASIFYTIYYNGSFHALAIKAIEECELNLPRNQHCTIVGVVKENK